MDIKNEKIFFISFLMLLNLFFCVADFKKVCYYTNWAQFRPNGAEFYPEDINPDLCTHIIYAFAKIENYNLSNTEESDIDIDNGSGMYERIMALKLLKPSLKIMLAVGGWAQGSSGFDTVVENDETIQRFASNAIEFLRKWNFDGLDVDWEFPVIKKTEFTKLLQKLRFAFDSENVEEKNKLELSIAVSAGQATIDTSYEVDKISQHVHFVNLMAYDFHGSWSTKTGFHSALYSKIDDMSWENSLNVDWSVRYWLEKGCPKEKLILGLAFYGRGFKLINPDSSNLGAPSSGSSKAGMYTKEAGFLSYFEICQIIKENNLVESYNTELGAPSIVYGSEWIGYENQESIIQKANYIKDNCLGGAMVWTIDFDDFKGKFCNQGNYPLMTILNEVLKESECTHKISTSTSSTTSTGIPQSTSVETFSTDSTELFSTDSTSTETLTHLTTTETTETNVENTTSEPNISSSSTETTFETEPFTTENNEYNTSETNFQTTESIETTPLITSVGKQGECNSDDFIASPSGCEYYQVCLKGFSSPVATLKCPDDNWFDNKEQTCVKNRPHSCNNLKVNTYSDSTTLFPYVTPGTTIFVYATASSSQNNALNTTESSSYTSMTNVKTENLSTQTTARQTSVSTKKFQTSRSTSKYRPSSSISTSPSTKYTTAILLTENIKNKKFVCPEPSGIFPNPYDCKRFWHCSNNMAFDKACPGNLFFDNNIKTCSWSSDFCNKNQNIVYDKNSDITKPPYTQPSNSFVCPQPNGSFGHRRNCKLFYQCIRSVPYLKSCPGKLMFNPKNGVCDFYSSCNGSF